MCFLLIKTARSMRVPFSLTDGVEKPPMREIRMPGNYTTVCVVCMMKEAC